MEKLQPKAVIFDLGSTLIEYEAIPWDELSRICVGAGRRSLLALGLTLPDEDTFNEAFDRIKREYREQAARDLVEWNVTQVMDRLLGEYGLSSEDGLVDAFFEAYYGPVADQLFIFDDTQETLASLRAQFGVIGLISNTIFPEAAHLGELTRFGIVEYFDFTVFSSTFGLRKPHPDIFHKAANLAGYAPSECVYIGDRYVEDILGPTNVGMPAILKIKPDREYPEHMPEATRRIDNLSEICDHLEFSVD